MPELKSPDGTPVTDFPGSIIYLPDKTPAPSVIMLHGSDGGAAIQSYGSKTAASFVEAGFAFMAFSYFGSPGKPEQLLKVELNEVLRAIVWLKANAFTRDMKVGLLGFSRGAEMALLLGSLAEKTDQIAAIAAYAPSDTVASSYDPTTWSPVVEESVNMDGERSYKFAPAWLWHGQAIDGGQLARQDVHPIKLFDGLPRERAVARWRELHRPGPRIEAERYKGPLYIAHGAQDEVWEVERSRRIVAARTKHGGAETVYQEFPDEKHRFSKAGYAKVVSEAQKFFSRHLMT